MSGTVAAVAAVADACSTTATATSATMTATVLLTRRQQITFVLTHMLHTPHKYAHHNRGFHPIPIVCCWVSWFISRSFCRCSGTKFTFAWFCFFHIFGSAAVLRWQTFQNYYCSNNNSRPLGRPFFNIIIDTIINLTLKTKSNFSPKDYNIPQPKILLN